ncbi:MAG: hypothetical protein CMQ20_02355 [Gammaproteobacteria bacterium]|jgi:aminoglycoside phosphotransferase (APT) family kinase protein|nr:hypothetical protein [Gammaproteobacteria bacterium]|tara:strand:- start:70 stop:1155 length:1086 start_codon:yes stop_codon:yes gene_type:complete
MDSPPKILNDVNSSWLTQVLHEGGALASHISVKSIGLEPMGSGVGMMSSMSRILINYDNEDASAPLSLVIKLPAENQTNRSVAEQFLLYLKEVRYYEELAPLTSSSSPKIYASYVDEDQNFLLLMEDASDYRMGNQVEGATLEECETCITELAKLHASFWGKLDSVDWLPHIANSENATNMARGAEMGWDQLIEYFGDQVPDSINGRREAYLSNIDRLQHYLDQSPITLVHGDFRMDNMLFGQKAEHSPLIVVDFQGPLKGKGIQDVAYFLSHSAQTEVRRQYERQLLHHYLNELRLGGVTGYEFPGAWEDYRVAVLYSWCVATVTAGTMDPDNDRGYAWMSKMVERNGVAIEDLDCLELL